MATHETFDLRSVIYGSFTASGVHEAIADFKGCEPHASEFGGSILLTKLGDGWSMVRYTGALVTTACRTYRLKTGRDILICEGGDGHMDETSQDIFACGFSSQKPPECKQVFSVINTLTACGDSAVWGSIDNALFRDANGDGMPDLMLRITVGQGSFPKKDGGSCLWHPLHATVQKYKLDFLFQQDTGSFPPAPWSGASAERLRALFQDAEMKAGEATNNAIEKARTPVICKSTH